MTTEPKADPGASSGNLVTMHLAPYLSGGDLTVEQSWTWKEFDSNETKTDFINRVASGTDAFLRLHKPD